MSHRFLIKSVFSVAEQTPSRLHMYADRNNRWCDSPSRRSLCASVEIFPRPWPESLYDQTFNFSDQRANARLNVHNTGKSSQEPTSFLNVIVWRGPRISRRFLPPSILSRKIEEGISEKKNSDVHLIFFSQRKKIPAFLIPLAKRCPRYIPLYSRTIYTSDI